MANKGYSTIPIGFKRVDNQPLEANTRFESLEAAQDYVSNNRTAYSGQIISVIRNNKSYAYLIQPDMSMTPLSESSDQVHLSFREMDSMNIEHSLNRIPGVIMILNSGERVTPKIDYADGHIIRLSWNGSLTGEIYLI